MSEKAYPFAPWNRNCLESLEIAGYNFLKGPLVPSFYRCPSNIDRTDRSFILARTVFSKESKELSLFYIKAYSSIR